MREIRDVEGCGAALSLTRHQVYHLVRRPVDPLPCKKLGKQLRFDMEKVWKWFDRQPGRDGDDLN